MTKLFTPLHDNVLKEAHDGRWEVDVVADSEMGHLHAIVVNDKNQDIFEISTAPSVWTAVSSHGTFVFNAVSDELQEWDHTSGIEAESWAKSLLASTDPLRRWCPELFRSLVEHEVEQHIKNAEFDHVTAEQLRDRVAEDVLVWSENEGPAMDAVDNFGWDDGRFVLYVNATQCYDYRYNTDFFWTLETISWMSKSLGQRF